MSGSDLGPSSAEKAAEGPPTSVVGAPDAPALAATASDDPFGDLPPIAGAWPPPPTEAAAEDDLGDLSPAAGDVAPPPPPPPRMIPSGTFP